MPFLEAKCHKESKESLDTDPESAYTALEQERCSHFEGQETTMSATIHPCQLNSAAFNRCRSRDLATGTARRSHSDATTLTATSGTLSLTAGLRRALYRSAWSILAGSGSRNVVTNEAMLRSWIK